MFSSDFKDSNRKEEGVLLKWKTEVSVLTYGNYTNLRLGLFTNVSIASHLDQVIVMLLVLFLLLYFRDGSNGRIFSFRGDSPRLWYIQV